MAQLDSVEQAPGEMRCFLLQELMDGMRSTAFWSEDFSEGIPSDWETMDVGGVAFWEYRGPDTDPSNAVASIGSCVSDNASSQPLESPTVGNGFAIFDSNYWDDTTAPCGSNPGDGPSPGPHDASLVTPALDFTDHSNVAVRFNHLYFQWVSNSQAFLEVQIADGEWSQIWESTSFAEGTATAPDAQEIVALPEAANGSDSVRLRWRFVGEYYWWMVDDIELFEIPAFDLAAAEMRYGFFDALGGDFSSFAGLEYTRYPTSINATLKPKVLVVNEGAQTQNDVDIQVVVDGPDGVVYDQTNQLNSISGQNQLLAPTNDFTTPNTPGNYTMTGSVTGNASDTTPDDNTASTTFAVTQSVFARDNDALTGTYVPSETYFNAPWEVGNIYHIEGPDQEATSISAALSVGSSAVGATITARIYRFTVAGGIIAELIGESSGVAAAADDFNAAGGNDFIQLDFDAGITLESDSTYLVTVGNPNGAADVLYGFSGEAPDYSSWVKFNENNWFFLTEVPMVRLNFGTPDAVQEFAGLSPFAVYPQPAQEWLHVGPQDEISSARWFDSTGRRVSGTEIDRVTHASAAARIRVPDQSGIYILQFLDESGNVLGVERVVVGR